MLLLCWCRCRCVSDFTVTGNDDVSNRLDHFALTKFVNAGCNNDVPGLQVGIGRLDNGSGFAILDDGYWPEGHLAVTGDLPHTGDLVANIQRRKGDR